MADIWKEVYKPKRKGELPPDAGRNHMPGVSRKTTLPASLSLSEVWYVRVCSFTFAFHTLDQVGTCLAFYSQ